jgi:DNA-cytosine methyltransferase
MFKYVSLFSGIGGFDHAMDQIGGECVLAAEWDKHAKVSYNAQFGFTPEGDVTKIDEKDVPDHQILVAGFPCQAFSVAGLQRGFEDARGTLFFEAARIAKYKQPNVLLFENVKGLVSHDQGRTLEVMIRTLDEIGYTVDFEVLNSKFFNVAQNRERIFIVAVRNDLVESQPWVIGKRKDVVAKGKQAMSVLGIRTFNFDWPEQTNVNVRLRDILEPVVAEKYYLSEEKTAKLVSQLESRGEPKGKKDIKMVGHADIDGHDFNRRIYSVDGVSRTLNTASDIGRSVKIAIPQVTRYIVPQTVRVRKNEVDIEGLRTLLRDCKKKSEKSNRQIAEHLQRPVTEVEHWFRTDHCFSVPDAEVWEALKWFIEIPTDEFDAQVTEFEEREGVFDKAERCYDINGLAPTLTATGADEKIVEPVIIEDFYESRGIRVYGETAPTLRSDRIGLKVMEGDEDWNGCSTRTRAYAGQAEQLEIRADKISNTITSVPKDSYVTNYEPKINVIGTTLDTGAKGTNFRSWVYEADDNLVGALSATMYKQPTQLYGESTRYRIRKLTPLETWLLQGFTREMFNKAKAAGVSDSQLYKQAGNSVTIPKVKAIGERLLKYI